MIGYFAYLLENTGLILAFLIGGITYGLVIAIGDQWEEKLKLAAFAAAACAFVLAPALLKGEQVDNNRHFATCNKYEAKQAGYIFAGERCWKPSKGYIVVNKESKTKQELSGAK